MAMMHTAGMALVLSLLAPAGAGPDDGDDRRGERQVRLLVMPLQARAGGSQFLGTGLSQVIAGALQGRPGYDVQSFEMVGNAAKDQMVPVLQRCLEARCAIELATRLGFDEIIIGVVDGQYEPALLRLWRIGVADGTVLAMFSARLSEDVLNNITDNPVMVGEVLMEEPGTLRQTRPPATAPAPVAATTAPPPEPNAAPAAAPTRTGPYARFAGDRPLGALARFIGAFGLGVFGVGLVGVTAAVVGYGVLGIYNATRVLSTGVHLMPRNAALLVDGMFGLSMLAGMMLLPVLVMSGAALTLAWLGGRA